MILSVGEGGASASPLGPLGNARVEPLARTGASVLMAKRTLFEVWLPCFALKLTTWGRKSVG